MEPNSVVAALQTLLANNGNIGAGGLTPPVVKPQDFASGLPQGQANPPSIMPRKQGASAGNPMDVRPAVARQPAAPAAAAAPASGKPSIMDKIGRYGSAASGGMGAVSPDASPLQAFGEALFGAMKSRAESKAAADNLAYERTWKEGERDYQHGRDSKADARAAASEARAAAEMDYRHGRDKIEDERWAVENQRKDRESRASILKTAAEIDAEQNGKPLSEAQIEDIIAKRFAGGVASDAEVQAERDRLHSIGRRGEGKDTDRAPSILGAGERPNNKGDRGGPSIMPQPQPEQSGDVPAETNTTTAVRGADKWQNSVVGSAPIVGKPNVAGAGKANAPYTPRTMEELAAVAKPGDIYVNPADGKLYRYKGTPAKQ